MIRFKRILTLKTVQRSFGGHNKSKKYDWRDDTKVNPYRNTTLFVKKYGDEN